jgi:hypothetical protein
MQLGLGQAADEGGDVGHVLSVKAVEKGRKSEIRVEMGENKL